MIQCSYYMSERPDNNEIKADHSGRAYNESLADSTHEWAKQNFGAEEVFDKDGELNARFSYKIKVHLEQMTRMRRSMSAEFKNSDEARRGYDSLRRAVKEVEVFLGKKSDNESVKLEDSEKCQLLSLLYKAKHHSGRFKEIEEKYKEGIRSGQAGRTREVAMDSLDGDPEIYYETESPPDVSENAVPISENSERIVLNSEQLAAYHAKIEKWRKNYESKRNSDVGLSAEETQNHSVLADFFSDVKLDSDSKSPILETSKSAVEAVDRILSDEKYQTELIAAELKTRNETLPELLTPEALDKYKDKIAVFFEKYQARKNSETGLSETELNYGDVVSLFIEAIVDNENDGFTFEKGDDFNEIDEALNYDWPVNEEGLNFINEKRETAFQAKEFVAGLPEENKLNIPLDYLVDIQEFLGRTEGAAVGDKDPLSNYTQAEIEKLGVAFKYFENLIKDEAEAQAESITPIHEVKAAEIPEPKTRWLSKFTKKIGRGLPKSLKFGLCAALFIGVLEKDAFEEKEAHVLSGKPAVTLDTVGGKKFDSLDNNQARIYDDFEMDKYFVAWLTGEHFEKTAGQLLNEQRINVVPEDKTGHLKSQDTGTLVNGEQEDEGFLPPEVLTSGWSPALENSESALEPIVVKAEIGDSLTGLVWKQFREKYPELRQTEAPEILKTMLDMLSRQYGENLADFAHTIGIESGDLSRLNPGEKINIAPFEETFAAAVKQHHK